MNPKLLDEHIATSLLSGIISNTKGFQTHSVTPRSLSVASNLISAGARRDIIIKHLYQTKSLAALKLWGRALANIQSTPDGTTVWTGITREDLRLTGASPKDATGALDELMVSTPAAKALALFVELNSHVQVYIALTEARQLNLPEQITPETPTYYTGQLPGPLRTVMASIIELITK
jgi:nanoRNase/pAp phosphatase (c-di-AMP/oligoRNAs hydrolase)